MSQHPRKRIIRSPVLGIIAMLLCFSGLSQTPVTDSSYRIVVAGKQYNISESRQKKWGEHYRKEWSQPVKVRVAMLDTLVGGLTPYQTGGGRQSKTLRLRDANGREYVLRSVDKSFGKALPEIAQGTFLEAIANDQASIGHPYAAVTIPPMAQAAGIFHTRPQILFIPKQTRLGAYNDEFGDMLYLFEQRPDENWEDEPNFGNAKNIVGTEKLLEKLGEDNDRSVDQRAFVRARLFDMLIGDWGRHDDQWRWAQTGKDDDIIYRPIPRDRDQAYTKFDGNMVTLMFSVGGFNHLQSFDNTIEDVTTYNFPARHLDRRLANEVTEEQWIEIAKELQLKLTDTIIVSAIRRLPPEVFPFSGQEMIDKLKSRRDQLPEFAKTYARFLAKAVDIPGSDKREYFEITGKGNDQVGIQVFKIKKDGTTSKQAIYSRTFSAGETEEIRLYGMDGNDIFVSKGDLTDAILMRIVPGDGKDSIEQQNTTSGRRFIHVYDNESPALTSARQTRMHISRDTMLNNYQYRHFEYDDRGFVFRPGITLGVGYHITKQGWRKMPFSSQHRWMGYYGPNRGSVAFEYRYIANQFIGKWNVEALLRADIPFVANFYGVGNESVMNLDVNRKFYRYRSIRLSAGFDINRLFDSLHRINITGILHTVDIKNDPDRFIGKAGSGIAPSALNQAYYASTGIGYRFKKSDHPIVPVKGVEFNLAAVYTQNIKDWDKSITTLSSSGSFYLPLFKKLSLAVRVGGETVTGEPEFYQLATLSGKENLRGYRRQRFYGKTSVYNNNELRLVLDTRNRLFNGKIGLLAFLDQGRVWLPGEESDKWHRGYGGGFFFAPFNRILFNASYGISAEDKVIHFRIGFLF